MPWYPRIFTIKKDGTRGSKHRFQRGRCSVGTAAGCDIHIRGADSSYCLFLADKNMLAQVVNVTGSAGVKHNGERVRNTSFLSHGDIVQIGSRQFRFEWVNKRKKKSAQKRTKKSSKVAAASHQPKAAGDARESSTKNHESDNEARHEQQSRNRALHSSTSSTPLIDESRKRARRSRSCLPGMHNSFEEEYPSFQEGQSCSSLKRRSQSLENSIAERSCKLRRWRRNKGLKVNSFSHKENSSGFLTPGSQSWYPNGKATTDESFLDSPGLSRRALIRSQASLCHTSLSSSAGSLGCESFFKTPNHTDSISKRVLGPLTAQDVSNSSLGNKRAYKRLSHIANPRSHQSHAKSFTASPLSSRSRPSLEKNTNGAHTPSDHSARSTWANSSLGQNSECTNSFKRVVTADETISSFDGSNCEGQFGASTLGFLEQEEGVSAKKTGSKCAISTDSTSKKRRRRRKKKWNSTSFNESPGDKEGAAEVPSRAARSSITNSAVDSLTWVQLGSEGLLQGVFYVPAVFLNMVTPASNNRSKKESPEQEHAVASEEGDDKKEGVPPQYARDESQSDQESLEHMGIMAESPKVTVSKQTFQCSSQTLENSRESALEKATLLTRSGRFSHTPTSKEMREEVSELEATGTASALKAPTSRRTLRSSNVTKEMNRAVSTLSPGHMTLDDVDVENKEAQAQQNVDTPKPFQTSGGKQTPASSKISASEEATEQVIMGTSPIERPPLMNISPVVAESVGTQSTRSPCALTLKNSSTEATGDETVGLRPNSLNASGQKKAVSRKVNIEAPQQEMADTPKSLKASAAKQISASKKIKEGQGDLKQTTQASPSECVSFDNASAATEGFVRFTISSLSSASRNVNAVTPGMEEVCSQNVMGGSRVSSKSKEALAQETVDTPKSLNTSGGKQTPASSKISASEEATEQVIMGTSPIERPPLMNISPVVAESVGTQSTRSPCALTLKNSSTEATGDETVGLRPNSLNASGQKKAVSRKVNIEAPQQEMADTPKSLKASAAKQISASKKIKEGQGDLKQTTQASPSECVSFDNASAATEGFVRFTISSLSSASRNVNAVTPGMEEVCSQNVMGGSRVSSKSKEALAQEKVDTPKSLKTSGGKQTPASSKISASEEATEQVIMGTSPIERPPLMNISPVVAESVGTQSTRSPCALTLKNSSTEATGDETVGLRPNSLNASGEKKVVSRKVNIEAPQQEMADTPKSLKASEAKQISASKKIKEGQGDHKQTTQASPSECVSFDNASAATEGFVRFTISSLSSASRNVNAVTPGMEEVCSQNVMGGSRVSSKSKEALAQETVDTPKSLNTSGGKQTPASGEIIVLVKEATEQNIVGASPVESPKSLEASTAHWASSASNVVKEDLEQETRASPSKQVNEVEEVPELETAGVSLSKCSSATNVHALADEPVRPTRGCCTRGSRKDNEEAREEKKVDHPQSTKATRAKHTQGSRKAVKVDMAQTATEATPRKTRGRRAKALETALEWADDKPDASRRTAEDHSEEAPPAKRARKKV